nr:unnamed protein product [Callosobruchus analis]
MEISMAIITLHEELPSMWTRSVDSLEMLITKNQHPDEDLSIIRM